MSVKILCPYCGQRYEIENYQEGATIECACCNQTIALTLGLLDTEPDTPIEIGNNANTPLEESTSVSEATREIAIDNDEAEDADNQQLVVAKPKKKTPILCAVLNALGIVLAICLFVAIVGVIISEFDSDPFIPPREPPLGLMGVELLSSLSCFGLSQIVQCLFDIRENSVRQIELLKKLVDGKHG